MDLSVSLILSIRALMTCGMETHRLQTESFGSGTGADL
jgi:hypothetical protein